MQDQITTPRPPIGTARIYHHHGVLIFVTADRVFGYAGSAARSWLKQSKRISGEEHHATTADALGRTWDKPACAS